MSKLNNLTLLIPEEKKFIKGTNQGSELVREIFNYYETLGNQQVFSKEDKFRKLYNLAHGKINIEDYIGEKKEKEIVFKDKQTELDDIDLMFYPIIPSIRNGILGEYDRKYIEYEARAINSENTNQVLDQLDTALVDNLISNVERLFQEENPNPSEIEVKQFQQSKQIQDFYKKKYRTEIEEWANHMLRVEDQRYNMKLLERKLLDQIIVTENPTVHVQYVAGNYYPEVLNEKDSFYLKSPMSEDYSEGMMFGWYNRANIGSIINKWGADLSDNDVKRLELWGSNYKGGFVINGQYDALTGNRTADFESTQNFLNFKRLERTSDRRHDEWYQNELVKETHIYFLLPRKKGALLYRSGNVEIRDIVDESFISTIKPIYEKGMPKIEAYLIEGEHVDWYYENELWYGVKLNYNNSYGSYTGSQSDNESIWVKLQKHEIQYSGEGSRYGVRLPVHGGSVTNYYNDSFSLVEKCAPWQIMYNWVWNRNQQLLATEVGKFIVLNEAAVPNESLEGTWGKDNIQKWLISGRDTGVAPVDLSISNMGQSATNLGGGIAEVIDMTKTQEIIEKANLARMIKMECYQQVGLSEDYLYGKIEPRMSAQTVAMGNQRSSTQIQWIYTRLNTILRKLRTTMLETAQTIESNNPISTLSYSLPDSQREVFKLDTETLPLAKLDIFIKSNLSDIDVLEKIKNYMLSNNTLGADSFELAIAQTSKSVPELLGKLRKLKEAKEEREKQLQQQQQAMQEQQLQAAREQQEKELAENRDLEERKMEKDIMVAQIKAMGYANDDAESIQKRILELQDANRTQQEFYNKIEESKSLADLRTQDSVHKHKEDKANRLLKEKFELKKLQQKDKELSIREKEMLASKQRTDKL